MGRVLAIDYGHKKIGMAISDESQIVVTNLQQIPNDNNMWNTMKALLSQYNPETIIIGYPSSHLDQLTKIQKEILEFREKISRLGSFTVALQDESYSSQDAGRIYIQNRGNKKTPAKKFQERKEKIDSLAAHILLRNYLNIPVE